MKKNQQNQFIVGIVLMSAVSSAQALVMDFGSGVGGTQSLSSSYTQAGLTMTPLDTGTSSSSFNHWDYFKDSVGANSSDWSAGIHTGNEAEEVEFTFGGMAFDLISIDIEGILLDVEYPDYDLVGTFTSSTGEMTTTSSVGTVDFTGIAGFQNITSFTLSMPLGVATDCGLTGENCSTMIFDNIQFRETVVPVPAALWLFGSGLLGLVGLARRKEA